MKKIILFTSMILCFVQSKAQLYHEDFEVADSVISTGNPGWFSNNRVAASGLFSDSSSIQNAGDTSILTTLLIDCSVSSKVYLTINHICKVDYFDQATIEYSTDSGLTYTQIGGSYSAASYPIWSVGIPTLSPENTWWKFETFNLSSFLASQPKVIIRFILADGNNNGGGNNAGWFIDNIRIDTISPPDAGPESILNFGSTAIANSSVNIDINVKNYGFDTIFFFNASYSLNGGNAVTQPWTGTLLPGANVTVSLPNVTIPAGSFGICVFTDLIGDVNFTNDTLCISSFGLPLISVPYSDDFEGINAGWYEPNTAPYSTLWELGTPNYGVTNSAHSGTRAWDTNLDTSYFGSSNSILYSPYFDFSGVGNANISFWLNYKTEPLVDGLRLEYNANATGWVPLGLSNNPYTNNWYTDSLLNSSQLPGWEGNSSGWQQSSYPLPSLLANQANVQFRFIFTSDNSVNSDGVTLDDFSIALSTCGNSVNFSTIPTLCGDSVVFNLNASAPVANIFWDLGNGTTFTQPTVSGFYTFGNYFVTLYTVDSNGCAASSITPVTSNNGFSVNAGPDVLSCGAAAQLISDVTQPGGYNYTWSPFTGLNNPFIPNPTANHVDSLTYTITVTDSITGCVATDQVMVAAYSAYNTVISICNGGVAILDLGPGANAYLWQTFTDTLGNLFPLNIPGQTFLISQPGLYNATATFPTCGILNSSFQINIDTSCITDVWPGDCNFDLGADNFDLLNVGLAYGKISTARPGATNNWVAEPSPDWPYYLTSGINFKHSDCNGDGIVDSLDVPVILQNYGLTHPPKPFEQPSLQKTIPAFYLTANVDTAGTSDQILVSINLGTTTIPVDSIYGIAFTISYEQSYIDTASPGWDYSSSWLGISGTEIFGLEKHFASQGFSDFALSRINQLNVLNNSGSLAVMTIVTTDNLSGKSILHFNISDVKAITYAEQVISLTTIGDTVVLDPNFTGIPDELSANDMEIFPNPVKSELIIKSKVYKILSIEIKNALGEQIRKINVNGFTTKVNLEDQPQGIFFLSVLTDKGVISKKVQVIK